MNGSDNPIVLTGGAGFIGSHLADALLRRGANLTIIDNFDDFYSPGSKRQISNAFNSVESFGFFN